MITRILRMSCPWWLILLHSILQLQTQPFLICAQAQDFTNLPANPNNCISAPCTYKNECRDKTDTCGDTAAYCNTESFWVPACGGGAGLDKVPMVQPTWRPTMRPIRPPQPQPQQSQSQPQPPQSQAASGPTEPSAGPTTVFQLWVSNKNQPSDDTNEANNNNYNSNSNNNNNNYNNNNKEQDEDKNKGVIGYTTGNEGQYTNYTPTNTTNGWEGFDANTWDSGVDRTTNGESAMEASKKELVFLASVILAWAILL